MFWRARAGNVSPVEPRLLPKIIVSRRGRFLIRFRKKRKRSCSFEAFYILKDKPELNIREEFIEHRDLKLRDRWNISDTSRNSKDDWHRFAVFCDVISTYLRCVGPQFVRSAVARLQALTEVWR